MVFDPNKDRQKALKLLDNLLQERRQVQSTSRASAEKNEWRLHAHRVLIEIFGTSHALVQRYAELSFDTRYPTTEFEPQFAEALGIVGAARREVNDFWHDLSEPKSQLAVAAVPRELQHPARRLKQRRPGRSQPGRRRAVLASSLVALESSLILQTPSRQHFSMTLRLRCGIKASLI
jgi:hypothetical protein